MIHRIAYIIAVIFVGFLSGVLGALVYSRDQIVSNGSIPAFRQTTQDTSPLSYATDVMLKTSPSIARVVKYTSSKKIVPHVSGVFISSDGWIVAPGSIQNTYKVLDKDNYFYEIKKIIYHPGLDISFIQSTKKESKPIELLDRSNLTDTMEGFILTGFSSIQSIIITPSGYPFERINDEPLHVHELARRFNYDQEFGSEQRAVFTLDGTLVGFTSQYGIIPLSTVNDLLPQIFKKGALSISTLPFPYHDLAWSLKGSDKERKTDRDQGALVAGKAATHYRLQTKGGKFVRIASGDIIISVNGERVDRNRGLSDIIQQYRIGDNVTLGVVSKEQEKEKKIDITLESFK